MKSAIRINGSEVLPLGGIAKKLTVMCNESGEWITYRSDAHGFNNPEGIWQSRDLSVAAVGDSFAFGACVPSDKNFAALIRKRYPATLNLGINGAGPLVELAAVKEFLPFFRPKVTLWFYLELNDQSDLNQEKRSGLLMRYLKDNFTQGLVTRQAEIDRVLTQYTDTKRTLAEAKTVHEYLNYGLDIIKLSTVRTRLGLVYGTSRVEASFRSDELQIRLFREILQNAQAFIKTWDGMLYFVYLPAWQRYISPQPTGDNRDAILALVRGLNIPVIDIHQVFQADGDPLRLFPFRQLGHYNEEGHRLVAETVLRYLSPHSSPCELSGSWSRNCFVRDRYPHEQRAQ
ncbi:MAG: SGNH/GDSL hydrolase family protein [Candidatus Binatia bacterium]